MDLSALFQPRQYVTYFQPLSNASYEQLCPTSTSASTPSASNSSHSHPLVVSTTRSPQHSRPIFPHHRTSIHSKNIHKHLHSHPHYKATATATATTHRRNLYIKPIIIAPAAQNPNPKEKKANIHNRKAGGNGKNL